MPEDDPSAEFEPPLEVPVRSGPDRAEAEEWSLALAAVGVPHRLQLWEGEWRVAVLAPFAPRANEVLTSLESEAAQDQAEESPTAGFSLLGPASALGLLALYYVTGPRDLDSVWFQRGSAISERLLHGEAFRAVTALTLHADPAHVFGNALAAVFLVGALGSWVGYGGAAWVTLLAGALGNVATALMHPVGHNSVGASTATFAALGALTSLTLLRRAGLRPRFVALGAGLALLGFLGTAKGADLGAHLFGFAFGALLGPLADRLGPRSARVQALLAAGALATVVGAWMLALHGELFFVTRPAF